MNNSEGRLHFILCLQGNGVTARIESTRPLHASRAFEGKDVQTTLKRLPLLFNICGQAQSVAAIRAVESSLEIPASKPVEQLRDLLVMLESLREHLWRILLDWPSLAGESPLTALLSPLHQKILALQNSLNPDRAATQQPGCAVDVDLSALHKLWQTLHAEINELLWPETQSGSLALPERLLESVLQYPWPVESGCFLAALPAMPAQELTAEFQANQDFIAAPQWGGKVYETGPYARLRNHPLLIQTRERHGDGVYTRLTARVIEVQQLLEFISQSVQGDRVTPTQRGEGGIAQVEAVRGRLVHAVEIENDRISRYRILAPTEWNFHPQGIAMQMLSSLESPEQLKTRAAWIIQAIDPCVGYDITVIDESH